LQDLLGAGYRDSSDLLTQCLFRSVSLLFDLCVRCRNQTLAFGACLIFRFFYNLVGATLRLINDLSGFSLRDFLVFTSLSLRGSKIKLCALCSFESVIIFLRRSSSTATKGGQTTFMQK
jgi:hypothetical protein